MKKNLLLNTLVPSIIFFAACYAELSHEARSKGFVYLQEVDPTIQVDLRYYGNENFLGRPVEGYKKDVLVITQQAAQALKAVQADLKKDGYELVVYDAYRPQHAVDHFMRWRVDLDDQKKKAQYYPRVNKEDVVKLGYVADKSGHSRGSTVDLTIIKLGSKVQPVKERKRTLLDGFTIRFLDDRTVDMGSSFDLFDEASHHTNNLVEQRYKDLRTYLKTMMIKHNFKPYEDEWWHYTLKDEPYPADKESSYHNFPIE